MYLWVAGRWYFLVAVMDAYSRYIVHWELLTSMLAHDVVAVTHAALLLVPGATPRIVHDRGGQFMGKDFKAIMKHFGLVDIKIRVNHPQSNGIYERFNGSTRREGIGDIQLRDLYHAREIILGWIEFYNTKRLHSSLGYLPPIEYYRGNPDGRQQQRREKHCKHASPPTKNDSTNKLLKRLKCTDYPSAVGPETSEARHRPSGVAQSGRE